MSKLKKTPDRGQNHYFLSAILLAASLTKKPIAMSPQEITNPSIPYFWKLTPEIIANTVPMRKNIKTPD
jgi:hypothetical protein